MAERKEDYSPGDLLSGKIPSWAVLPLRFFLGGSFLIAGLDKLNDPTFLDTASRDYIGNQIAGFAPGTPLEGFLTNFAVPNANMFGVMVMGGEICIGLAVLLGVLTRFSAAMGALLNLTFFLSATWNVRPFYFGADLPYLIGWLTLALAGPGLWALDHVVSRWLAAGREEKVLTVSIPSPRTITRRAFLGLGAAALTGFALTGAGAGWRMMHPTKDGGPQPSGANIASASAPPTPAEEARGQLIAVAGAVPVGQTMAFTLPTGDPAVLVHNDTGYTAYVAICTHQNCEVQPRSGGILVCPCHNSEFDANAGGEVISGPARRPLSPVTVTVDPAGNVYLAG
jgi:thiosulfate dehydrogenase [quinone] large subunit